MSDPRVRDLDRAARDRDRERDRNIREDGNERRAKTKRCGEQISLLEAEIAEAEAKGRGGS